MRCRALMSGSHCMARRSESIWEIMWQEYAVFGIKPELIDRRVHYLKRVRQIGIGRYEAGVLPRSLACQLRSGQFSSVFGPCAF